MTTAFPLQWPEGHPRTPAHRRRRAPFVVSLAHARDELLDELRKMPARHVVISSNLQFYRKRGRDVPYANQPTPADPGVAVYFVAGRDRLCLACDAWTRARDNIRAIGLTVGALRGLQRWGVSDVERRAFTGFRALPEPDGSRERALTVVDLPRWARVFGFSHDDLPSLTLDVVRRRYRYLVRQMHPDLGGDDESARILTDLWNQAQQYFQERAR